VVSTEDRAVNPHLERFMTKRMGATTIEVKASHLSYSQEVTDLIMRASGREGKRISCDVTVVFRICRW
jgi:hypothetical protein